MTAFRSCGVCMKMRCKKRTDGFTLIEVVISIAIVAFGITGLMFAMAAGTRVNEYSGELGDAVYLADQAGVIIDSTAFDDLPDLNGNVYQAVDSIGNSIEGLDNFQQVVSVRPVNPLTMADDTSGDPQAYLVTVVVNQGDVPMTAMQWLKVK